MIEDPDGRVVWLTEQEIEDLYACAAERGTTPRDVIRAALENELVR
jgi:hypothetical protein